MRKKSIISSSHFSDGLFLLDKALLFRRIIFGALRLPRALVAAVDRIAPCFAFGFDFGGYFVNHGFLFFDGRLFGCVVGKVEAVPQGGENTADEDHGNQADDSLFAGEGFFGGGTRTSKQSAQSRAKQTFSASLRPRRPSVMLKEMCCPSAGRRVRVVKAARARKISWPVSSMVAAPKPRLLFQRVIVP